MSEEQLTPNVAGEQERKAKRNKRLLWALIALDILTVGYLIFQMVIAMSDK